MLSSSPIRRTLGLLGVEGREAAATRSVVLGTLGNVGLNGGTLVANFLLLVVLTRALDQDAYGTFVFVTAWATILSVPASLGLQPLVVRNVAGYLAHERWSLLRGVLRRSNQAVVGSSVALMAAGAAGGWVFLEGARGVRASFLISLLLIPLISLATLRQSAMQGLHRVVLGRIPDTVLMPVLFLVFVATAEVVGAHLTAQRAASLNVLAALLAFVVGTVMLRRVLPRQVLEAPREYEQRAWIRSGVPFLFLGLLLAANVQIGTILVGLFEAKRSVGIYNVSSRVALFTSFLFLAATYPLSPNVARLWAHGDLGGIQRVITRTGRLVFAVCAVTGTGIVVLGHPLLRVFGHDYDGRSAYVVLCLLVAGELVKVVSGFGGLVLVMTKHEVSLTRATALQVGVNVGVSCALLPVWGVTGAAVGSFAGSVAIGVYGVVATWRQLGLYSPVLGRWTRGGPVRAEVVADARATSIGAVDDRTPSG